MGVSLLVCGKWSLTTYQNPGRANLRQISYLKSFGCEIEESGHHQKPVIILGQEDRSIGQKCCST